MFGRTLILGLYTAALGVAPVQAQQERLTGDTLTAQAQKLGDCMVSKSTGEDRIDVARWMVAAMASAPKLGDVVRVDPAQKIAGDKKMAQIFTRLMTRDCLEQARPLFKARSEAAFEVAGESLGRIAVQELLSDKKASQELSGYTQYLQEKDFVEVAK